MGLGKNAARNIAESLGPVWGDVVGAIVDGGVGAITARMVDHLLPRLAAKVQRLDDPTSVLGNHDLLQAMRNAKLAAIGAVVHETQRKRGGRLDDSVFLDSIAGWADRELSRNIKGEVDPRFLGNPETLPPARDEIIARLFCLARGVEQHAKEMFKQDGAKPEAAPFFTPCDHVAIAFLEHFFTRESSCADFNSDEDGDSDHSDIETLQASVTLLAFGEALKAVGLDWRNDNLGDQVHKDFVTRFVDPNVGFFAWFRSLIQESLVSDERFRFKVVTFISAETQIDVRALSRNLVHGLDEMRSRLDLVLEEFKALKQILHNGLMRADAGLVLRDISEMLVRASEGRDELRHHVSVLTAGPKLERLIKTDSAGEPGSPSPLRFTQRMTPFIGRNYELKRLHVFLYAQRPFHWWQIAGEAGQGKSRLALELVEDALSEGWNAGFLRPFDGDALRLVSDWIPERKTLMVIDYVAPPERAERLGEMIDRIEGAFASEGPPLIRLLVLERQAYDLTRFSQPDDPTQIPTTASWHDTLFCNAKGERARRVRASMFQLQALTLRDPKDCELIAVASAWSEVMHQRNLTKGELEAVKTTLGFSDEIRASEREAQLSGAPSRKRARRPLFAMLASESALQGECLTEVEGDPIEPLLKGALDREREELFGTSMPHPTEVHENLMLLSNMVGELDVTKTTKIEVPADLIPLSDNTYDLMLTWRLLGRDVAKSDADTHDLLYAREPDLLAEYQVLQFFEGPCQRIDQERVRSDDPIQLDRFTALVRAAWQINPVAMWSFLHRTSEDFPLHPALGALLQSVPEPPWHLAWAMGSANQVSRLGAADRLEASIVLYAKIGALARAHQEAALYEVLANTAFSLISAFYKAGNPERAVELYIEIKALAEMRDEAALYEVQAKSAFNLIVHFSRTGELERADRFYAEIGALAGAHDVAILREHQAVAAFNLTVFFGEAGELERSIGLYDEIRMLAAKYDEAALRKEQAKAAVNLINGLGEAGELERAIGLYGEIKALAAAHDEAALREELAKMAANLIIDLGTACDLEQADGLYGEIKALVGAHDEAALRKEQAKAAFNLIHTFRKVGDLERTARLYAEIKALAGAHNEEVLRDPLSKAAVNLINDLGEVGELEQATKIYAEMVVLVEVHDGAHDEAAIRERLARAAFNLISAFGKVGDLERAVGIYGELKALVGTHNAKALREVQVRAARNLINGFGKAGELERATEIYGELQSLAEAYDEAALRGHQAKAATSLTAYIGRAGELEHATALYKEIKALAGKHDEAVLREEQAKAATNILNAMINARDPERAAGLHAEIKVLAARHDEPTLRTLQATAATNLIKGYGSAGNLTLAVGLYTELKELAGAHDEPALRERQAQSLAAMTFCYMKEKDKVGATPFFEELQHLAQTHDEAAIQSIFNELCKALGIDPPTPPPPA